MEGFYNPKIKLHIWIPFLNAFGIESEIVEIVFVEKRKGDFACIYVFMYISI
jgi:hypothetical protein